MLVVEVFIVRICDGITRETPILGEQLAETIHRHIRGEKIVVVLVEIPGAFLHPLAGISGIDRYFDLLLADRNGIVVRGRVNVGSGDLTCHGIDP